MDNRILYSIEDRTVQILAFNFQIDEQVNPWLFSIKGDFNFTPKAKSAAMPSFDDIKAHLLNETVKVIERKVAIQREIYHRKRLEDKSYALKLKDATNAD